MVEINIVSKETFWFSQPIVFAVFGSAAGMNGYELAAVIRVQPWGREIVLIAATGWGSTEDRARTEAAGFNAQRSFRARTSSEPWYAPVAHSI